MALKEALRYFAIVNLDNSSIGGIGKTLSCGIDFSYFTETWGGVYIMGVGDFLILYRGQSRAYNRNKLVGLHLFCYHLHRAHLHYLKTTH